MTTGQLPDREIVLIVDDMPANLNLLSVALDEAGLVALVALDAHMALEQLKLVKPGVILLDLIMPGMDGFELCRILQSDPATHDIPVIFMTALGDTDHIVQGFSDGAVDYVVKPIRPSEVVARIKAHLRRAKQSRQARAALDFLDHAAIAIDGRGDVLWMTERCQELLVRHFRDGKANAADNSELPDALFEWVTAVLADVTDASSVYSKVTDNRCLTASLKRDPGLLGGVLLLSEETQSRPMQSVREHLGLTAREAEILMWVAYGKTNRQIGEILNISPRTVNKHLDHVYLKLGVETRAAAAAIATRNAQAKDPRG